MMDEIGNVVLEDSGTDTVTEKPDIAPADANLVKAIVKRIKSDKKHHEKSFERMREDMFVARNGHLPNYPADYYKANIAGRHVKQKTAALYAKNPKVSAKRRETLDFAVWDEDPASLEMAFKTLMMGQQMTTGGAVDPETGQASLPLDDVQVDQVAEAVASAQAIVADYQQGTQRRQMMTKVGRTLEVLFTQAMREQKPVDFKTAMKQLVRRTCTTAVGYIELGFQREMGPRPGMMEKLADFRARLDHLRVLAEKLADPENPPAGDEAEIAELEKASLALQQEPEVIIREGLIMDFPPSTRVIPDQLCKKLVGFIGARHLTVEYMYTCDQVKEIFGVDITNKYKGYNTQNERDDVTSNIVPHDGEDNTVSAEEKMTGLVCVWKHYDKAAGLVYYLADGYEGWLREPASPDVFVEDFWPVYALTFNDVENEKELFPPSDVRLMLDQQTEYNRSRQGMREHRFAALPRFVYNRGAFQDEDASNMAQAKPFTMTGINVPPDANVADLISQFPIPGVDPNLYETNQLFTDIQLVVGTQEAQLGGVAKATATESAIAANSTSANDNSSIDDLDAFLTVVARSSGQILLREMSAEQVTTIVGPGALWPQMSLSDIVNELFLEVEAGSTGKPNQAVEIDNWNKLAPLLIQIPGISPIWLAKEAIRRLDDRVDITEAISPALPSIMAQNAMSQPTTQSAESDPNAQGGQGSNNAPRESGAQRGSEPAFGSNQV